MTWPTEATPPTAATPTGADPTAATPTGADPTAATPTGADATSVTPGATAARAEGASAPASRLGRVRAATLVDVIRSEATKLRTVRSTWITLLIAAAIAVGIGAAVSAVQANHYASSGTDQLTFDPTSTSLSGFALAQLAIAVLGVLFITSEYSSGMIRTSLAAVPGRSRLLGAKILVFSFVSLVLGEVLAFISFFLGQSLLSGSTPTATLGGTNVLRAVIGAGLYLTVLAIIAVGIGTVVRSTAGAIATIVGLLFVLPGVAQALPTSVRRPITKYWPTNAGSQITSVVHSANDLGAWAGFGVMCLFAGVVVVLALVVITRRDA